ncbi:protein jag [Desulfurivibrio sp. D14AmB]|uniref:Jag family protein n=1 Tax=Desulfurivibrio sp. D14AmB TaxID=3374370 RepID=UPI00376F05D8
MSALMEYKGDDVDQAITNACAALGVDREALEIQVVTTGSAGIFGLGRRKAVVRVGLKVAAAPVAAEVADEVVGKAAAAPEKESAESVDPLSPEELAKVAATVARLLELTGRAVEARVGEVQPDGKIPIELVGEESELLVGSEGQVLDSLQYLLRKMLTKELNRRVLLELDAGGYRDRRHQELRERALALAAEVKSSGQNRTLAAVGPAERRIIHLALQGDSEIRSRSVGEGLFKKVLIHLPGKGGGRRRPPRSRGKGRS